MKDKPIKMFELRYAERETGETKMNEHGWLDMVTITKLEYRARYHTPFAGSNQLTEWTEWTEVPTEYFRHENIR
jgi:hypothetical protein